MAVVDKSQVKCPDLEKRKKLTVLFEGSEYANLKSVEAAIASEIEYRYPVGHSDFIRALFAEYLVTPELRERVVDRVRSGEFYRVRGGGI